MDDRPVGISYENSNKPRLMASFYFPLLPVVYHIPYYAFSQDLLNTGQLANQHEKVNS